MTLCTFIELYIITDKKPHMPKKKEPDAEVKQWAVQACHRCLVYLGDIGVSPIEILHYIIINDLIFTTVVTHNLVYWYVYLARKRV